MIFEAKGFFVDLVENKDLNEVVEVYNSNKNFLASHMDKEYITNEWLLREAKSMKELGFNCCKIVEISSGKIIGVMDFKINEETYLSLLIIHNDFRGKGFGQIVFQEFQEHVKLLKSNYIRIEAVSNYDNSVLNFWIKNGFIKIKDVELNWTGKTLPAVMMKKFL